MIDKARERTERISQISDIDIHDLLHPEDARDEQASCNDQHDDSVGAMEQQADVARVHSEHVQRDPERQEAQYPCRQSAFGGQHLDLAAKRRSLAERIRHCVKNLSKVTSDLSLDVHGENSPFEVWASDTLCKALERILSRTT